MRRTIRSVVIGIVAIHGLIHLMGVVKGLGWADVSALTEPISTTMAFAWLGAAMVVVAAAALLAMSVRWWWIVGGVAAVVSQAVIVASWGDAKAATIANVILMLAALHGFLAEGPSSLRATYRRLAVETWSGSGGTPAPLVTDGDLAHLPVAIARYIATCGAIGQPHVRGFRALIHGRIRGGVHKPWMTFTGEQVNTYGTSPSRVFSMDATMAGVPVDVLHAYLGPSATMRVKACSAITMVDTARA